MSEKASQKEGRFVIRGSCYQDFVNILLANGYELSIKAIGKEQNREVFEIEVHTKKRG